MERYKKKFKEKEKAFTGDIHWETKSGDLLTMQNVEIFNDNHFLYCKINGHSGATLKFIISNIKEYSDISDIFSSHKENLFKLKDGSELIISHLR
jgi:hypothetical protein